MLDSPIFFGFLDVMARRVSEGNGATHLKTHDVIVTAAERLYKTNAHVYCLVRADDEAAQKEAWAWYDSTKPSMHESVFMTLPPGVGKPVYVQATMHMFPPYAPRPILVDASGKDLDEWERAGGITVQVAPESGPVALRPSRLCIGLDMDPEMVAAALFGMAQAANPCQTVKMDYTKRSTGGKTKDDANA